MDQEITQQIFLAHKLITSALAIGLIMLMRWLLIRHLEKQHNGNADASSQRWINNVKNTAALFVVIALVVIWLSELRFLALSIAAFAVALVIATREFIQCFLGSVYLASSRLFVIGDWIKVGTHYGEVIRSDWLSTILLEIDIDSGSYRYTGKTLIIPNNQFVASPVQNLNFMRRYVCHTFHLTRDAESVNICHAKELIEKSAAEFCAPFFEVAARYNQSIENKLGIKLAGPEPVVRTTTNNLGKSQLEVTIFCPTEEATAIEQRITEVFMDFWYNTKKQEAAASAG